MIVKDPQRISCGSFTIMEIRRDHTAP